MGVNIWRTCLFFATKSITCKISVMWAMGRSHFIIWMLVGVFISGIPCRCTLVLGGYLPTPWLKSIIQETLSFACYHYYVPRFANVAHGPFSQLAVLDCKKIYTLWLLALEIVPKEEEEVWTAPEISPHAGTCGANTGWNRNAPDPFCLWCPLQIVPLLFDVYSPY